MKQIIILILITIPLGCWSQNWEWISNQVDVENNADPNKAVVYDLWKSFIEAHDDTTTCFPQWNEEDRLRWKQPDLISSEGFLTSNLYAYLNKVLEIRPENGVYVIRSMFYTPYNDDKAIFVLAITNHVVKKDKNGAFKIHNWIDYHTRKWQQLIKLLHEKLDVNIPEHITQFIAPNVYEQQKMKGFDYLIGMGNEQGNSGGSFDKRNFIIYGDSVHGENYQHEIARLINPTYPNAHFLIIQGLSEYVNTSQKQFGLSHRTHYGRMKAWLDAHPDADLTDMDDKFYTMDNQTSPAYLVGKIVCHELFKKGGYQALKRALATGKDDSDFYGLLKNEIGIGKDNFNRWLRERIGLYSMEDIPPLQ